MANRIVRAVTGATKGRKMNRLATTMLTAACALAPLALVPTQGATAQSVVKPANDIALSIGRGQLVSVGGTTVGSGSGKGRPPSVTWMLRRPCARSLSR